MIATYVLLFMPQGLQMYLILKKSSKNLDVLYIVYTKMMVMLINYLNPGFCQLDIYIYIYRSYDYVYIDICHFANLRIRSCAVHVGILQTIC